MTLGDVLGPENLCTLSRGATRVMPTARAGRREGRSPESGGRRKTARHDRTALIGVRRGFARGLVEALADLAAPPVALGGGIGSHPGDHKGQS